MYDVPRDTLALVEEITRVLGDDVRRSDLTWWQYVAEVIELKGNVAQELVQEVLRIQAAGGMLTSDGRRPRTSGGIFFVLAHQRLGPKRVRALKARALHFYHREMLRRFLQLLTPGWPAEVSAAEQPSVPKPKAKPRAVPVPAPEHASVPLRTAPPGAVVAVPAPAVSPISPPSSAPRPLPREQTGSITVPALEPPPSAPAPRARRSAPVVEVVVVRRRS
jgi:hypothetical protein